MPAKTQIKKLSLPCIRGKMGDTMFYCTLMLYKDIAERIKLPAEIDEKYESEDLKLGDWIQRKIQSNRIRHIVSYIRNQEQRFFNSLIVGIFDGSPSWQDILVQNPNIFDVVDSDTLEYLNRTFGILTLEGTESLFAIDGQHRAVAIRKAVEEDVKLKMEEISVIFVAHKTDPLGKIRTRRLFSTLNKYAKPVSASEIIALSEDNNCAIITRELVENFPLLQGRVQVNKNRSIHIDNKVDFTNIMVLFDIVERLLTDKKVYGISVSGHNKDKYITVRANDVQIEEDIASCKRKIEKVLCSIPSFAEYLKKGRVDRRDLRTNLIFRPIGQNIVFDVYKVALEYGSGRRAIKFFEESNFSLSNKHWKKVFYDEETNTIVTEKSRQRYATLLILERLGIEIRRTKKDLEIYNNFQIKAENIS